MHWQKPLSFGKLQLMNSNNIPDMDIPLLSLFPSGVMAHYSGTLPADARLLPAEADSTHNMIEKRQLEFTHGRYCARQAMQKLELPATAIPKGADRAPVWPDNICGSISHSGDKAAAVIAWRSELAGIGLDIESAEPLTPEIAEMVCRPEEQVTDMNGEHAKLLFSIKEAVYKCIYPLVHCFVDFQEMEIVLHEQDASFSAQSHSPNFDANLVDELQGRYYRNSELIVSSAWILQGH
jgi:4'-phosphopantetheinyl transferase EntD